MPAEGQPGVRLNGVPRLWKPLSSPKGGGGDAHWTSPPSDDNGGARRPGRHTVFQEPSAPAQNQPTLDRPGKLPCFPSLPGESWG